MGDFLERCRTLVCNKATIRNNLLIGNASVMAQQGATYYVDSGSGSDSNSGANWGQALATLDAAINKCTANQGDIILLAPGHSESYTTTGTKATFDVAGITIISTGKGADRASFSFGHTGATFTISAASVVLVGLLFITAIDSVTTFATISGTDCKLIDCETRDVTDKEVITDFTVTGDRFTAINHFKNGYTGGNANVRVFGLNGVDNALIQNCIFITKVTTAVINFITTLCTNVVIDRCTFYVKSTTDYSKNIVDTIGSSEWLAQDCFDIGVGASFSGGSGAAIAGDDVSAVATALATLQAEFSGAAGITTFPAGAAAANSVSVSEVIRYIQENIIRGTGTILPDNQSIYDILTGTNGIATFPAAANPGNGVSIAEVLRDAWDNIGDAKARTNLQSIVELLGNPDVAAQSIWDCLAGAGGIATFPAGAASANDVSLAEVIRYIQENIIRGTGTILPDNQSLYDILTGANGIATFPAGAAPANDVSLAEVIRDIWDALRNGTGGSEPGTNKSIIDVIKQNSDTYNNDNYIAITADMSSGTWNTQTTHEILTVTGLVRIKICVECVSTLTDAGDAGTIQLGVEGTTNDFIASSDTDNVVTGSIWADNTPGDTSGNYSSLVLDKVVNGLDIGYEIGGEALTGGSLIFHCWWTPINSTGAVVAGAGGAL